jgi:hypothetical protein
VTEKKPTRRPKAQKPEHHSHTHPRSAERNRELMLAQITKPGAYMMETLVRKAKLPTQRQYGVPFLAAPCPIDGSHTDGDALVLQLGPDKLFCRAGDHAITLEEFLGILAQGDPDEFARYVDLLHPSDPEMPRFYCFETERARAVSEDPETALEMLRAKRDEPVRGVIIEADSIQIAKQLLGQPASRKKMRFCQDIPRTDSGKLANMSWHLGGMTERERLIDARLREEAEAEQRGERLKHFQRLKMELAL